MSKGSLGTLHVAVLEAQKLHPLVNSAHNCKTYVKITLQGRHAGKAQTHSTPPARGSFDPVWQDKHDFLQVSVSDIVLLEVRIH